MFKNPQIIPSFQSSTTLEHPHIKASNTSNTWFTGKEPSWARDPLFTFVMREELGNRDAYALNSYYFLFPALKDADNVERLVGGRLETSRSV